MVRHSIICSPDARVASEGRGRLQRSRCLPSCNSHLADTIGSSEPSQRVPRILVVMALKSGMKSWISGHPTAAELVTSGISVSTASMMTNPFGERLALHPTTSDLTISSYLKTPPELDDQDSCRMLLKNGPRDAIRDMLQSWSRRLMSYTRCHRSPN